MPRNKVVPLTKEKKLKSLVSIPAKDIFNLTKNELSKEREKEKKRQKKKFKSQMNKEIILRNKLNKNFDKAKFPVKEEKIIIKEIRSLDKSIIKLEKNIRSLDDKIKKRKQSRFIRKEFKKDIRKQVSKEVFKSALTPKKFQRKS